jgi:hypothetical protein
LIVNIGGWLYIVTGALCLLPVFGMGWPHVPGSILSGLVFAAFSAAVGIGLLLRANWGRWLALGVSLLTWTLGSIGVLVALTYTLRALFMGGGLFIVLAIVMLIASGIFAAIIVINYKLFHYLITADAKDEFDTPEMEYRPVLKSTALYVAMACVLGWVESTSIASRVQSASMRTALREKVEDSTRARDLEAMRRRAERLAIERQEENRIARQRRSAEMESRQELARIARENAQLERDRREKALNEFRSAQRSLSEQQHNESRGGNAPSRDYDAESRRLTENLARTMSGAEDSSRSESGGSGTSSKILKCRDAAGSVQFTQGYCPAGTTRVEMPPSE